METRFSRSFRRLGSSLRPVLIDLAKEIDQPSDKVLEHIVYLRKNNLVAMESIDGTTPKYVSLVEGGK